LEGLVSGRSLPPSTLAGKRVIAASAIADPEGFVTQTKATGAAVQVATWKDHHQYGAEDVAWLAHAARRANDAVTTEKDAVRFPRPKEIDVPVYFLRIEVEILKGHDVWERLIDRLCHPPVSDEHVLRHRHAYEE